jgi:hypothetical protein
VPDNVVRLPKVSQAAWRVDREIGRRVPQTSPGISAERPYSTQAKMPFVFTRLTAMTREEVPMRTTTARSTNAFADLEAQLRALGATGDRLAEATKSLRSSAHVFATATARFSRNPARHYAKPRQLKLV